MPLEGIIGDNTETVIVAMGGVNWALCLWLKLDVLITELLAQTDAIITKLEQVF